MHEAYGPVRERILNRWLLAERTARDRKHAGAECAHPPAVNKLRIPALLVATLLLALLAWEFQWRWRHALLKPPSPSTDQAFVAEVRSLPPGAAPGDRGVFVRGGRAWLRSLSPQLVFAGDCDEVETRWFGDRRLVIDCELRAGEPRILQPLLGDVVIELVVQRRFADARSWPAGRTTASGDAAYAAWRCRESRSCSSWTSQPTPLS